MTKKELIKNASYHARRAAYYLHELAALDRAEPYAEEEALKIAIEDFEVRDCYFSVRVVRRLRKEGMNTVGDLIKKSQWELGFIEGLGRKSIMEIVNLLAMVNLRLRDD